KCVGKMQHVSRAQHKTVLFVSHNMSSVKQLCPRSIILDKGVIAASGDTTAMIQTYMRSNDQAERMLSWPVNERPRSAELTLRRIAVRDAHGATDRPLVSSDEIHVTVDYDLRVPLIGMRIVATLRNADGVEIFSSSDFHFQLPNRMRNPGEY